MCSAAGVETGPLQRWPAFALLGGVVFRVLHSSLVAAASSSLARTLPGPVALVATLEAGLPSTGTLSVPVALDVALEVLAFLGCYLSGGEQRPQARQAVRAGCGCQWAGEAGS